MPEPNPIQILQQQAAQKRDEAIRQARLEYTQTLRLIDDLGERLFYERRRIANRSPKRAIIELIVEAMPKQRPFQLREVLAKLRKLHPKRQFHEPTIRTLFKRLSDQGRIRKHSKGDRGFILWVASECPVADGGPLAACSLSDVAEQVLRESGPLRAVEVVLAVQERGYRPDADRRSLLNNLSQAFKRNGHRFTARAEYRNAMQLINDLAQRLDYETASPGKRRGNQRTIIDLILEFMPKDRSFAMREVLAKMRKAYPKRDFHEPTIRTQFKRLKDQGLIRPVGKEDRGFIVWAASACPIAADGPLAAVSIADAAERVLREKGPMRQAEIVLAVQENGYRPDANRRTLYGTLTQAFKRHKHRFVIGTDGKWSTV